MKISGWLCPNDEFIQCSLYEHIEVAVNNPVVLKYVPEIIDMIHTLSEIEEGCQDLADREGGHNAEWHIYEMACDKARPKIRKLLLNNGFIRVGESDGDLHFEGKSNYLKSRYQACVSLAEEYGARAVFEPQR